MTTTFVDTSGILALLSPSDRNHQAAWSLWEELISGDEALGTSSFVLVEAHALLQARFGLEAVRTMHEELLPLMEVYWVDSAMFAEASSALLVADRRHLSLVDCVSFVLMRRLGLRRAFAWDKHFEEQGFSRNR